MQYFFIINFFLQILVNVFYKYILYIIYFNNGKKYLIAEINEMLDLNLNTNLFKFNFFKRI